jgi:hypothetical protein
MKDLVNNHKPGPNDTAYNVNVDGLTSRVEPTPTLNTNNEANNEEMEIELGQFLQNITKQKTI